MDFSDQVQPRIKNKITRSGTGTPIAHNKIHPTLPF
jgi:hypothetical protein